MKKNLLAISILAITTVVGYSQTDTNYITGGQFLSDTWDTLVGQGMTNLGVAIGGTYTPSVKQWGEFVVVTRNIPIGGGVATGIGLGIDHYGGNFYAVNGQVSLKADMYPLSGFGGGATNGFGHWLANVKNTSFGYVGLGTPIQGISVAGSSPETVEAIGDAITLTHFIGADFKLFGMYGSRQGIGQVSGIFYGGGADMNWAFGNGKGLFGLF